MKEAKTNRRGFIKAIATSAAVYPVFPRKVFSLGDASYGGPPVKSQAPAQAQRQTSPRIRFAVIGINHDHIHSQIGAVLRGGGELVSFYAKEPDLAAAFSKRYPQARLAASEQEILEDRALQLVVSASIPEERAPLGIRVMQHGKDYMADKPGITTLEQLAEVRRVQAQTHRIYSIMYSERFENGATVKAGELVKTGAIGRVIQTVGLGPHRMNSSQRLP